MAVWHIQIFDGDRTAALVTQRGLQVWLQGEADVSIASSADAMLRSCLGGTVDLVIIDPDPKNPTATDLIRSIRGYRPDILLLVLTAYDTPMLRMRMRDLGVHNYLAKPLDLSELGRAVQDMLHVVDT